MSKNILYLALLALVPTVVVRAEQVKYLGETYYDCEKDYSWIKEKTLGYGPYGYVHRACSKKDQGDCQYAAKVQRSLPGFKTQRNEHDREADILKKLSGKNIAPNIYENFTCKIKNDQTGATREVGVIILDKFDTTFFDLLNKDFNDYVINKFGSKEKALAYFINSLKATNPTNAGATYLPNAKNGLVRANEALRIGRIRGLNPNTSKFISIPLSEENNNILSKIDDLLVKLAENKIIHRDMKVDNIMTRKVGDENIPIIIDFGLSYDEGHADDAIEGNLNGYWDETFQINAPATHERTTIDPRDYCYDRVLLEFELLNKYGIKYKFKSVDDSCRDYIYKTYFGNVASK
jgi:serine/threonine protein kinase